MSQTKYAQEGPNPTVTQAVQQIDPLILYGKGSRKREFLKFFPQVPQVNSNDQTVSIVLQQQHSNRVIYLNASVNLLNVYLPPVVQTIGDNIRFIIQDATKQITFYAASYIGGVGGVQSSYPPSGAVLIVSQVNGNALADTICADIAVATSTAGLNTVAGSTILLAPTAGGSLALRTAASPNGRGFIECDNNGARWTLNGHQSAVSGN